MGDIYYTCTMWILGINIKTALYMLACNTRDMHLCSRTRGQIDTWATLKPELYRCKHIVTEQNLSPSNNTLLLLSNEIHTLNCPTEVQLPNFAAFIILYMTPRQELTELVGLRQYYSKCFRAREGNKLIMDRLCVRSTRASFFNEEICINH